jgi:hypothetical protein
LTHRIRSRFAGCGTVRQPATNQQQQNQRRHTMKLQEAIETAARAFAQRGEYHPSHCDVRCTINDLIDGNTSYHQDRAFHKVRAILAGAEICNQ